MLICSPERISDIRDALDKLKIGKLSRDEEDQLLSDLAGHGGLCGVPSSCCTDCPLLKEYFAGRLRGVLGRLLY